LRADQSKGRAEWAGAYLACTKPERHSWAAVEEEQWRREKKKEEDLLAATRTKLSANHQDWPAA